MSFAKNYGVGAILFLVIYGLFILGSISGGIGITGNAINFLEENTDLFIYIVIGIGVLILAGGIFWFLIKFFKKAKQKKKELQELNLQNKKSIIYKEKKQKDRMPKIRKNKLSNNQKINKLLLQGEEFLANKNFLDAKKIYLQIRELYNPLEDKERKLYQRILDYYKNLS